MHPIQSQLECEPAADALVALRTSDLSLVGSWQVPVSQQVTDGDFGTAPTLFQATIGGVVHQMVGLINKNGIYYAFDRTNISAGPVWQDQLAAPPLGDGIGNNISSSEWDGTYAFTGLIDRWSWRLQYERDAPLDKSGIIQAYADTLLTSRFQAKQDFSWWQRTFPNQNLTAYAGAGWLFHNSNYFARPDNTGSALFRYVAHADLDLYKNRVVLYGDMNFFTDREAGNKLNPSELDWIIGLALRFREDMELSVYREQDQPLDKAGLVQKYVAVQLRYSFDVPKRFLKK